MSTTPDGLTTPGDRARPTQGTAAELEITQRWWLTWIYGPAMGTIAAAALVTGILGTGDRQLSLTMFLLAAASLAGALVQFRARHRSTGRIALDERDETANMRMMGYAYCFAFFGAMGWAVVWAATDDGGTPVPLAVLGGLALCLGAGRLCTRREGF